MEEPSYGHQCIFCQFLGRWWPKGSKDHVELYFCRSGPTLVADYGGGKKEEAGIPNARASKALTAAYWLADREKLILPHLRKI